MQEIITYIILTLTLVVIAYRIYKSIRDKKTPCESCGSECSSCPVTDMATRLSEKEIKS